MKLHELEGDPNQVYFQTPIPDIAIRKRLSVLICPCRDDDVEPNISTILHIWLRNSKEFIARGIEVDWRYVEWDNATHGKLTNAFWERWINCHVIDKDLFDVNDRRRSGNNLEWTARNAMIEAASNDTVLIISPLSLLGADMLDFISEHDHEPDEIWIAGAKPFRSSDIYKPMTQLFRHYGHYGPEKKTHQAIIAGAERKNIIDCLIFNKTALRFGFDESGIVPDNLKLSAFIHKWDESIYAGPTDRLKIIGSTFRLDFGGKPDKLSFKGAPVGPLRYVSDENRGLKSFYVHEENFNILRYSKEEKKNDPMNVKCPHCNFDVFVAGKGKWRCPVCETVFQV